MSVYDPRPELNESHTLRKINGFKCRIWWTVEYISFRPLFYSFFSIPFRMSERCYLCDSKWTYIQKNYINTNIQIHITHIYIRTWETVCSHHIYAWNDIRLTAADWIKITFCIDFFICFFFLIYQYEILFYIVVLLVFAWCQIWLMCCHSFSMFNQHNQK